MNRILREPAAVLAGGPDEAGIEVSGLCIRYGEAMAVREVSFSVGQGELVTLLGPSGCGKTTTLRAIAGLEQPCAGAIRLSGRSVYDAAAPRRADRNVPTERRGVSMVFQSYAIWPHMTVAQNVAYGLRVRRLPKARVAEAVDHALGLVQMRGYAARRATDLSGGQQQRVAVARAIAFSPQVLLFDEPLSNLDAKLRAEMRVELRELQQRLRITSLYVTHDQEEALAISDRVIVMQGGVIEQQGTPDEIYGAPASRFVADFVGSANMIAGRVVARNGKAASFETMTGHRIELLCARPVSGAETTLSLRTAYVEVVSGIADSGTNTLLGEVHRRMFHGDFIQYIVQCAAGTIVIRRPPTELYDEGSRVTLRFAPEHTLLL